jgi:signal transduction histidine kinase
MRVPRVSRLVIRFAVSTLIAFVAIGAVVSVVLARQIRHRQESFAQFHAVFVTNSILRYELTTKDLAEAMSADSARYQELAQFVKSRVVQAPVVRVKIWSADGTVLFSDDPRLPGRRFPADDELHEAFEGQISAGVSDLSDAENQFERGIAAKLFATYVPLRLPDATGSPQGVVEVYQDYAGIQAQVNSLFRTVIITMLIGLGVLYLVLLPIIIPVAQTLAEQNAKLEEQAKRSERLLRSESQTVAELKRLNRLQGEFVAVASHELRTPLTSIIGYAKTLRQPQFAEDNAARDEFLGAIERQGDRLYALVENLLTSSHMDDRILKLSVSTFSFPELCRDVVEGLGSKSSRVRVKLALDLPTLLSDRQYVAQILQNLLGNAMKFSPADSECEVGARWSGGSMTFWVRDHGIGIPEAELGRIFDRFYQVDSSSTRAYGGIGLGLSLVKNLVETLGGTIEVTSERGDGSMFTVTLPLVHPSVGKNYGHSRDLTPVESGEYRKGAFGGQRR